MLFPIYVLPSETLCFECFLSREFIWPQELTPKEGEATVFSLDWQVEKVDKLRNYVKSPKEDKRLG